MHMHVLVIPHLEALLVCIMIQRVFLNALILRCDFQFLFLLSIIRLLHVGGGANRQGCVICVYRPMCPPCLRTTQHAWSLKISVWS